MHNAPAPAWNPVLPVNASRTDIREPGEKLRVTTIGLHNHNQSGVEQRQGNPLK